MKLGRTSARGEEQRRDVEKRTLGNTGVKVERGDSHGDTRR